ncbi:protein-tyrosine phosphatase family protein [Endozoicomonas sp. OPT23]|uniref:protein-tyrosine phosphatase family protein n=1 Tax=Endozoicomonas sp. OPT23 TaxID=2072845 RepID=UPI0018919FFF
MDWSTGQLGHFADKTVKSEDDSTRYLPEKDTEFFEVSHPISDRNADLLDDKSGIQQIAQRWGELKSGFLEEAPSMECGDLDLAYFELMGKAEKIVNELSAFSVVGQRLSEQELDFYSELLNTMANDLKVRVGNIGKFSPISTFDSLTLLEKKLRSRHKLIFCMQHSKEAAEEISNKAKALESVLISTDQSMEQHARIKPRKGSEAKPVSEIPTIFVKINTELEGISEHVKELQSMDPGADLFWQASYYKHALETVSERIVMDRRWPESISAVIAGIQEELDKLSKTGSYRESERLYNVDVSIPARRDTVETDGVSSEGVFKSLSQENISRLDSMQELAPDSLSSSTASVQKPATVEQYHFINQEKTVGPFKLKPVPEERVVKFFKDAPELKGMPAFLLYQFRNLCEDCLKESMDERELSGIFASGFNSQLADDVYDMSAAKSPMMPLKHSQVTLPRVNAAPVALPANRISYNGREMGIAMNSMPGESYDEKLANTLEMVCRENTPVMVDLVSDSDRKDNSWKGKPVFDWGTISENLGDKYGGYTVSKKSDETFDLKTTVLFQGKSVFAKATLREFEIIQPDGEVKTVRQIAFKNWPDGSMPSPELLDELHELIDKEQAAIGDPQAKLLVNCHAGVGRTGSLFATRYLREKAQAGQLDPEHLDAEVFDVIVQGKLHRNHDFVQYPEQAQGVREAAVRYVATSPAKAKPEIKSQNITIGGIDLKPVTVAMGQAFSEEVTEYRSVYSGKKKELNDLTAKINSMTYGTSEYHSACRQETALGHELHDIMVRFNENFFPHMQTRMSDVMGDKTAEAIMWTPMLREKPESPVSGRGPYAEGEVFEPYTPVYGGYGNYGSLDSFNSLDVSEPQSIELKDIEHRGAGTTPLAYNQVKVKLPGQKPIKMSASHIQIAGVHKGIAMQAPRPEELDCVLQTIMENQTGVVVDLLGSNDRRRSEGDPMLDWNDPNIARNSNYFEVSSSEPQEQTIRDGEDSYSFTTRTFTIKPKVGGDGKERTFSQISFPDWPDGQAVPHPVLKQLLAHVDKEQSKYTTDNDQGNLMMNCRAGLGRTGVSFVGMHIMEQAVKNKPTEETLGQLTLEGIIHGRVSRSGDFVQFIQQASELIELERSYI